MMVAAVVAVIEPLAMRCLDGSEQCVCAPTRNLGTAKGPVSRDVQAPRQAGFGAALRCAQCDRYRIRSGRAPRFARSVSADSEWRSSAPETAA